MTRAIVALYLLLSLGSVAHASGYSISVSPTNAAQFGMASILTESSSHTTKDLVGLKLTYSGDAKFTKDLFATKLHIMDGAKVTAVVPLGMKRDDNGMMVCIFRIGKQQVDKSVVVLSFGKGGLKAVHYRIDIEAFIKKEKNANK
jgi:hypothetical protein